MFDRFRRCPSTKEFASKGLLRCNRRRTHIRSGIYKTHMHLSKDKHEPWSRMWAEA